MRKNKRWVFFLILSFIVVSMSGCKMKREIAIDDLAIDNSSKIEEQADVEEIGEPVTIYVKDGETMDLEVLLDYFYGETGEELIADEYASDDGYTFFCEKNAVKFTYTYPQGENINSFVMMNENEWAGSCYNNLFWVDFLYNEVSARLIDWFPEEEIDACSSQKAKDACLPIAEACGYGDAQVNVYAMNLEGIQEAAVFGGKNAGAPNSEVEYISDSDLRAAKEAGDTELLTQYYSNMQKVLQSGVEWEKGNEAYFLVYRSKINGLLMDTRFHQLICIYVPSYEKVVYVEANRSLALNGNVEDTKLITEEDALATALVAIGVESAEDITITGMSLVYSPRYEQISPSLETRTVDPCWRIDYEIDEDKMTGDQLTSDDGTIMINAVDGQVNTYAN